MKKIILISTLFLGFLTTIHAKIITGKVTDIQKMPLPGVSVIIQGENTGTVTDFDGNYTIEANENDSLEFVSLGFMTEKIHIGKKTIINVSLKADKNQLDEIVVVAYCTTKNKSKHHKRSRPNYSRKESQVFEEAEVSDIAYSIRRLIYHPNEPQNTESYASVSENNFKSPLQTPLSTFSIDVDAASYSNMRRFLMNGQKPPTDAVRIEEMINYFDYNYPQPTNENPFSITTEVSECPWNTDNKLIHIGLQGKKLETNEAPASNLVFLVDVSGSMRDANKLPLLKKAFSLLVNQLREKDKISIVVYAGSSGVVLPSTRGNKKEKILNALNNLHSGGGTAGAEGLKLAYQIAEENFIKNGNNRIILATDGDFNVGQSSDNDLEKLIVKNRDKGIFISVTGFGMGNYKDSKMEIIADKGNGNYAYIDNILEAKKVFVNEFSSTLFTIAKDVKIQIEFNPKHVREYRLVGYENRLLNAEDFNNDKKDAGELGAGHTVTALYEIVPLGSGEQLVDQLKYQTSKASLASNNSTELATVKFRYKKPEEDKSKLIVKTINTESCNFDDTSSNFKFSSAVAGFGMLLKESDHKSALNFEKVLQIAKEGKGNDEFGYRSEFIRLVELASEL